MSGGTGTSLRKSQHRIGFGTKSCRISMALGVLSILLGLASSTLQAHVFSFTETRIRIDSQRFSAFVQADLDALALGVSPREDSQELAQRLASLPSAQLEERLDRLRRLFERRIRIRFDGSQTAFEVSFPDYLNPPAETETPSFLGTVALLSGDIPNGAQQLTFFASRAFPPVQLRVESDGQDHSAPLVLDRGEISPQIDLRLGPQDIPGVFFSYLKLGFWHILPQGSDHILFVLGLFLLGTRLAPLLWQVSAFTLAHTVTLAASSMGLLQLPPGIVEPLIALSIVYVGIENCWSPHLRWWRLPAVFAFGLLHGFGFAGVLSELGLPQDQYFSALLAFNLGVEMGQVTVLAGAFVILGAFRSKPYYRKRVVIPSSFGISLVALFWALERLT